MKLLFWQRDRAITLQKSGSRDPVAENYRASLKSCLTSGNEDINILFKSCFTENSAIEDIDILIGTGTHNKNRPDRPRLASRGHLLTMSVTAVAIFLK